MPEGESGRIFVGNDVQFEGYTGGGNKDEIDGLLSSGDVGHFDDEGRLFIDGRDDDMIVSGGENVFPAEVEDLLMGHENVADVAVFGVEDEKFGQRLKAVIVKKGSLSEKDVQDYVKKNLAGYKAPRDVVFVDELPRTSTGKVLKRELKDACPNLRACLSARTPSISRASGSPPARAGAWTCTSTSTRSTTAARATRSCRSSCPCAWTSPAPPATAGRCGCASTATLDGPCMRCLENATPTFDVDSYEVHQPGGGERADLALHRRRARPRGLGARRAGARAAGPAHLPPGLRGPVPAVRREPQRGPGARARARARPALVEAVRAEVRVSRPLPFSPRMAVPKQKQSHARTAQRRAQHKITAPAVNDCPQCRRPRRPHRVCPHCGFYGGREVVHVHDHDHDHEH